MGANVVKSLLRKTDYELTANQASDTKMLSYACAHNPPPAGSCARLSACLFWLPTCTKIDEGVYLAFAGISADGRVLASKIRLECQSYRYRMGAAPSVSYIARYVGMSASLVCRWVWFLVANARSSTV